MPASCEWSNLAATAMRLLLALLLLGCSCGVQPAQAAIAYGYPGMSQQQLNWQHAVDLNEDFRLLWTIGGDGEDITFEMQARTLGYVGFGLARPRGAAATTSTAERGEQSPTPEELDGADMAIGWIAEGHTFFQDRHVRGAELLVDPSQDYVLLLGYENATHTVIRFQRKLNTCDSQHDIAITNDTMRLLYLYSESDPPHTSMTASSIVSALDAWRPARSMLLTQRPSRNSWPNKQPASSSSSSPPPTPPTALPGRRQGRERILGSSSASRKLPLRNQNVPLPLGDDTLIWCSVFKLEKLDKKQQIIRYAPIYDSSWSIHYLQQITLYECQQQAGAAANEMDAAVRRQGQQCMTDRSLRARCTEVVAAWTRGSEEFAYPPEAGYPLEAGALKYYLLETIYSNRNFDPAEYQAKQLTDNSGIRLEITSQLRPHDAGVLSIGIDSNWRHIIPPGQRRVISQGQCIEDCTRQSFPAQGISIFAVMMRTHQIGREFSLRQIRDNSELPPIVQDKRVDSAYQEFRQLRQPVVSRPGDRLVAECVYDTSARDAITLGGLTMKEESCNALALYYPRQQQLTTCHSLPSLPTVLHSLGIEQLAMDSNPIVISAPAALAGMTLEARLLSYDWAHHFDAFQRATLDGSFKPICLNAQNQALALSKDLLGYRMNVSQAYRAPHKCKAQQTLSTAFFSDAVPQLELPVFHDIQSNHISTANTNQNGNSEGSAQRSSRSSTIETLALSGTKSSLLSAAAAPTTAAASSAAAPATTIRRLLFEAQSNSKCLTIFHSLRTAIISSVLLNTLIVLMS